jgi:tRNA threonylcarbamoyladenosine biosynthesis protein TsaB
MSVANTILAIDTAAPRLQLALLRADGSVDVSVDDIAKGHAELIFPRIDALLGRNGLAYADLARIAVTTGPGSFTGLRIGLSAAHGLGLALDIPVIGVPSLLAISLAGPPGQSLAVLLDARRDEAYVQRFSAPGLADNSPGILPLEQASALVAGETVILTSPFIDIARLALFARDADPKAFPPDAAYIRGPDAKPQEKARIARKGDQP